MPARDIPAFIARDGGRARHRARRGGDRGARPRPRGPAVHRRLGRGPQDRVDRRPRLARRHGARVRGQRRQRRRAVPPGHRLRAARRADDVGGAGDRPSRRRSSASGKRDRLRLRAGARACASGSSPRRGSGSRRSPREGRPAPPRRHAPRGRRGADRPRPAAARIAVRERGDAVECPVCGGRFRRFKPHWNRAGAICWRCGAHERHRAVALLWRRRPELLRDAPQPAPLRARVVLPLHAAPCGPALRHRRPRSRRRATSRSTSARSTCPTRRSARSSAATCSSTSTATADALAELRRVLEPGGWALLMVPQDLARADTLRGPRDRHPRAAHRGLLAARPRPPLRPRLRRPRARRRVRRRVDRDGGGVGPAAAGAPRPDRRRRDPPVPPGTLGRVSTAPARLHVTRSRANPGGMDVTKVLGTDTEPFRGRKPRLVQGPAAGRQAATAS